MLAAAPINSFNRSFENVTSIVKLNDDRMFLASVEIAPGQCLEVKEENGREETLTLVQGTGALEIDRQTEDIPTDCVVKLVANKVYRIFNRSKENLHLWCCSTPADKFSEEKYIRRKEDCFEIKTGNKENIRELFGVYENGPSTSHSVAIIEIGVGGSSHPHVHPIVVEAYAIIAGTAKMIVGKQTSTLKAGDVTWIKPGEEHQIINEGEGPLRFVAFVNPPWTKDCGIYK